MLLKWTSVTARSLFISFRSSLIFHKSLSSHISSKYRCSDNLELIKTLSNSSLTSYTTNPKSVNKIRGLDETKAKLILQLNLKDPDDAVPFYKLPIKTLIHIYKVTKNDEKNGYCQNRLYYIAHHIKCPPSLLSQHIVKRTFIYGLSFDWLQNSLNILLEMGVNRDRILRDLWVLKYHPETIRERLQKVKDLGIDTLYPWMVRCSEKILERSIRISQDTKEILGETKSKHLYLANRLNISLDEVADMCFKIPALKTIRVTKVKAMLDFLLLEGFKVEDIANKPRIFTASQKTLQNRIEKLHSLGLNDINLNILCRSKKDFKRYCQAIESSLNDESINQLKGLHESE